MQQPEGFSQNNLKVCKLLKSLYGLKQASRMWNEKFSEAMLKFGFNRCDSDNCLYVKLKDDIRCYMLLYVDDLLIVSNNIQAINTIKRLLSQEFEMTDVGEVDTFLGIHIKRDITNGIINLDQS